MGISTNSEDDVTNPPTPTLTLKTVELDLEAVFPDPAAASREWLRQFIQENGKGESDMGGRDLKDYSPDELYAELGRIGVEKAKLPRKRDQYTDHTRRYWNGRRKKVAAELRRRGLPVRRKGSKRAYPTAAHLAVMGSEVTA